MNTMTKIIASLAFVAVLAAPASARMDNEDGASAYPAFSAAKARDTLVNRTHQR
jgi:hypothetical protein